MDTSSLTFDSTERAPGVFHAAPGYFRPSESAIPERSGRGAQQTKRNRRRIPPGFEIYCRFEPSMTAIERFYASRARQAYRVALYPRETAWLRSRSRKAMRHAPDVCQLCGYPKAVEVCHLVSLASFALGTPESVINHPRNLRKLCRNCHHELDSRTMDQERYCALMQHDDKPLTEVEIKQGWHFCVEADGLLVGPGMAEMRECECFSCAEPAGAQTRPAEDTPERPAGNNHYLQPLTKN